MPNSPLPTLVNEGASVEASTKAKSKFPKFKKNKAEPRTPTDPAADVSAATVTLTDKTRPDGADATWGASANIGGWGWETSKEDGNTNAWESMAATANATTSNHEGASLTASASTSAIIPTSTPLPPFLSSRPFFSSSTSAPHQYRAYGNGNGHGNKHGQHHRLPTPLGVPQEFIAHTQAMPSASSRRGRGRAQGSGAGNIEWDYTGYSERAGHSADATAITPAYEGGGMLQPQLGQQQQQEGSSVYEHEGRGRGGGGGRGRGYHRQQQPDWSQTQEGQGTDGGWGGGAAGSRGRGRGRGRGASAGAKKSAYPFNGDQASAPTGKLWGLELDTGNLGTWGQTGEFSFLLPPPLFFVLCIGLLSRCVFSNFVIPMLVLQIRWTQIRALWLRSRVGPCP